MNSSDTATPSPSQASQEPTSSTPSSVKRRWNWGWSIASVYTVFALATIAFAVFSFSQKVELVSNDYYARELAFDTKAAQVKNAQSLSEPVRCSYDASRQSITLHFPMHPTNGTVQLYRPSTSSLDQNFDVRCSETNEMTIPTAALTRGLWRVQVQWESVGRQFYNEFSEML